MSVSKLDATKYPVKMICIEENPAVAVGDLLPFLESSIQARGINTLLYRGAPPPQCEYTLWYTAFRGWDLAPYLNRAEFRLRQGGVTIASANYSHAGGLDLSKFAGTESKLTPVISQIFADFDRVTPPPPPGQPPPPPPSQESAQSIPTSVIKSAVVVPAANGTLASNRTSVGQLSYGAAELAKELACNKYPVPVMNAKGLGFETYTVGCANGDVLTLRCEPGQSCRVLK